MAKHVKPLGIPQDEENYGVIHGDFHELNWFWEEIDGEYKINLFDYDLISKNWFLCDLGTAIFHVCLIVEYMGMTKPKDEQLRLKQQFAEELIHGYTDGKMDINKEFLR